MMQILKTDSLYRRSGKPERTMAEIRRMLLWKISARLKSERLAALKEPAAGWQNNK
jgi:hypothetical protein